MIIPDKKRYMSVIMARRREPSGEVVSSGEVKPEISREENGEIDGRHQAAQDALMAMSEKSPQKFMEAMGNFIDLHQMKASEPEKK